MDFIALGGTAYAVRGGIQLESCEIYTDTDFSYSDVPPSIKAQLRDSDDKKPIYITTLFGKTMTPAGVILPSDDSGRVNPNYKIYNGTAIEAHEVLPGVAEAIIASAGKAAAYLEHLKVLRGYLALPDITIDTINTLEAKIATVWSLFQSMAVYTGSLTSGGQDAVSSSASGFPVGGSVSYTYHTRWGFGTLSAKLVG